MRNTGIFSAFALAAVLVLAGCRNDNGEPTTQPTAGSATASGKATAEQASAGQPVNKNCAIEQEHAADPTVTYTHNGKVYAFCCEDCIDAFKKDPAKYANAK